MHFFRFQQNIISLWIKMACFSCFSKKITDKRRLATNNTSADSKATTTTIVSKAERSNSDDKSPDDNCSICQSPFDTAASQSSPSDTNVGDIVSCSQCLSHTCKNPRCTIWLPKYDHWECRNCHHFDCVVYVQAYDWIFERLSQRFDDKAAVARVTQTTPINDTHSKSEDDVMLELNGNLMRSA